MINLKLIMGVACAGLAGWIGSTAAGCSPAEASTCDCPEPKLPEVIEAECVYEQGTDQMSVIRSFPGRSAADLASATAIGKYIGKDGVVVKTRGLSFHPISILVDDGTILAPCEISLTTHVTLVVPPSLQ